MNKKGLSPLTSTIILLVVSILIGIVVMSWGKGYVEQATAKADQAAIKEQQATVFEDLNARYEKGEISKEQYEEIKKVLLAKS